MDWQELSAGMAIDPAYSPRTRRLVALDRVLDGKQYDHILHHFGVEEDRPGVKLNLRKRRPSVRSGLCRKVVEEAVSMLFAENRFPRIQAKTTEESTRFGQIVRAVGLKAAMQEAAMLGSVGSVAILVKFAAGKVFITPKRAAYLEPTFDPNDPSRLTMVRERYLADADELARHGFTVKRGQRYWWTRDWTVDAEITYRPQSREDVTEGKPLVVASRIEHRLGMVPIVWVKNLAGGDDIDGRSTFEPGIDDVIQLDYLESQGARMLSYVGDPTVVLKGVELDDGPVHVGSGVALTVPADGDAKLLELTNGSGEAFKMECERLRRLALESMHSNMANPDRVSAATSGRMMELLHQPLIWLADRLRLSYGPALLSVLEIVGRGAAIYEVTAAGEPVAPFTTDGLGLQWGAWFDPTFGEIVSFTSGLTNATDGGIISHRRATEQAAPLFGIMDVDAERREIEAEIAAEDARLVKQGAQTKAKITETE